MEPKNEDLREQIKVLEARLNELEKRSPKSVESLIAHRFESVRLSFITDWLSRKLPNTKELLERLTPFKSEQKQEQFNAPLELMRNLPAYKIVRIARKYRMDLNVDPRVAVRGTELSELLEQQRETFTQLMEDTRNDLRAHFEREKYQIGRPPKSKKRP